MAEATPRNELGASTTGAGAAEGEAAGAVVVVAVWALDAKKRLDDMERERTSPRVRFRVRTIFACLFLVSADLVPISSLRVSSERKS